MRKQGDMDYYRKRALQERELASTSTDAAVALIHRELAERYEVKIGDIEANPRSPAVRAVDR
jgi:hypothetical protein